MRWRTFGPLITASVTRRASKDSVIDLILPGTNVPGYRLFRPRSASSAGLVHPQRMSAFSLL
jgi:hypothetical protein